MDLKTRYKQKHCKHEFLVLPQQFKSLNDLTPEITKYDIECIRCGIRYEGVEGRRK